MMENTRAALKEYLEQQDEHNWCQRIKYGECRTSRCLREGGHFTGEGEASCPRWRLQEALEMEP